MNPNNLEEKEEACCAHSRVTLRAQNYPNGTVSDYWECDSNCGQKFMPIFKTQNNQCECDCMWCTMPLNRHEVCGFDCHYKKPTQPTEEKVKQATDYVGENFGNAIKRLGEESLEEWENKFESYTHYYRLKHPLDPTTETEMVEAKEIKTFIRQTIAQVREEVIDKLKNIDWTHSQTGIAIGTKKAVISEAVDLITRLKNK